MKMQKSKFRSTSASRREARQDSARYIHVSCEAYMREVVGKGGLKRTVPYISRGTTYNVGRNAAKRAARRARS